MTSVNFTDNQNNKLPKIVVIGAGTGNATLLKALKEQPCDITSLVCMSDSGGSTGILRSELGVLPPGDIRQCLVALSDDSELASIFNYRFPSGSLKGHSVGNLFISAYEKKNDDFMGGVRIASQMLNIKGHVLPITLDNTNLVMTRPSGEEISGECIISDFKLDKGEVPRLRLEPHGHITPDAAQAIAEADLVVISPGNLYGSLAPALIVAGASEALARVKAPIVYICNLVNRVNQDSELAVHDYAQGIERFIGEGNLDYVLYNVNPPTLEQIQSYGIKGETPILANLAMLQKASYKTIPGDFLQKSVPKELLEMGKDSPITRSYIRHDAVAISKSLMELL
jgi:uncharacterized cofD-like protein